jgi:hypothetical protein
MRVGLSISLGFSFGAASIQGLSFWPVSVKKMISDKVLRDLDDKKNIRYLYYTVLLYTPLSRP